MMYNTCQHGDDMRSFNQGYTNSSCTLADLNLPFATAFVRPQVYDESRNCSKASEALAKGTLFPELYSPWPR